MEPIIYLFIIARIIGIMQVMGNNPIVPNQRDSFYRKRDTASMMYVARFILLWKGRQSENKFLEQWAIYAIC